LIASGLWFTPEREGIDALNAGLQRDITGSVRIKLLKGTFHTVHATADALAAPRA
jgi:argininosuccinate synthase